MDWLSNEDVAERLPLYTKDGLHVLVSRHIPTELVIYVPEYTFENLVARNRVFIHISAFLILESRHLAYYTTLLKDARVICRACKRNSLICKAIPCETRKRIRLSIPPENLLSSNVQINRPKYNGFKDIRKRKKLVCRIRKT